MASRVSGYLPKPLSTFIGRERGIAVVCQLLSENRLVTLTGPGGCGKTRLAIKVANLIIDQFEGEIWMAEFASIANPSLVPQTIASTLNMHEQQRQSLLDGLVNILRPRCAFLIFDNCEHLIGACAERMDRAGKIQPRNRNCNDSQR